MNFFEFQNRIDDEARMMEIENDLSRLHLSKEQQSEVASQVRMMCRQMYIQGFLHGCKSGATDVTQFMDDTGIFSISEESIQDAYQRLKDQIL